MQLKVHLEVKFLKQVQRVSIRATASLSSSANARSSATAVFNKIIGYMLPFFEITQMFSHTN